MQTGLHNLEELFRNVQVSAQELARPAARATPCPEKAKVLTPAGRNPVNKQAAKVMWRANWIHRPMPPEPLPIPVNPELVKAQAKLKTAWNQIGELSRELGLLRKVVAEERKARREATAEALQLAKKLSAAKERIETLERWRRLNT